MSKKKCCKSKKPCKDCPRNKKKKMNMADPGIADLSAACSQGNQRVMFLVAMSG